MSFLRLIPAFFTGLTLVACGQSEALSISTPAQPAASAPAPAAAKTIGLVMKTLTNPFFVEMEKGARRAESELGVKLSVKTAAQETSIEQQIQLVEDLMAARADAIVIAPGDSQRLVPTLKKAQDQGMAVVIIDNQLDAQAVEQAGMRPPPFVGVDNEAGAYKAAKHLVEAVNKPTEAILLEGIRSAANARQRADGARRAFAEAPQVKLVASETANWKIDEAYSVTQALFAKHPNIGLVFASNDIMAIGALKYLQESGRTQVKVVGYDALAEAQAEIRANRLLATVDQQAAEQGYQGVALALRLIRGETVAPVTLIDTRLITAETLAAQPGAPGQ